MVKESFFYLEFSWNPARTILREPLFINIEPENNSVFRSISLLSSGSPLKNHDLLNGRRLFTLSVMSKITDQRRKAAIHELVKICRKKKLSAVEKQIVNDAERTADRSGGSVKMVIDKTEMNRLLKSGLSKSAVARQLGISRPTLYSRLNES